MILLLLGIQGSGKDTQANLLEERLGFKVISTGQLMRDEMEKKTEIGNKIAETYLKGILTPDEIIFEALGKVLKNETKENIVLTGAVRRLDQVRLLNETLETIGKKLDMVIYLDLSDDLVIDRLSKRLYEPSTGKTYHAIYNPAPEGTNVIQREDDKPEAIKTRLDEFHKHTDAILEKYTELGVLEKFDAAKSIEEVYIDISKKLDLNN